MFVAGSLVPGSSFSCSQATLYASSFSIALKMIVVDNAIVLHAAMQAGSPLSTSRLTGKIALSKLQSQRTPSLF